MKTINNNFENSLSHKPPVLFIGTKKKKERNETVINFESDFRLQTECSSFMCKSQMNFSLLLHQLLSGDW